MPLPAAHTYLKHLHVICVNHASLQALSHLPIPRFLRNVNFIGYSDDLQCVV